MPPTVSIITITYNADQFLERTIRSVMAYATPEVDYIIIDGASTDRTLDIIRQYEAHVTSWISEPDRGLYDAMNKGLHRAQGEYVWFMNAGDELHDPDTLPRLLSLMQTNPADVYYSDALFVEDTADQRTSVPIGLRSVVTPHTLPVPLTWRDMALGMKVCHQAFVARRSIAPDYILDNLSADLDWEIRCLKAARRIEFVPFVLCRYLVGGLSVQQHRQSLIDRFRVLVTHFGWRATLLNHGRIVWRALNRRRKRLGS
ncbi:glycosyltransferase involved in cell wall biosynthesis [Spirosoma lacussanchae]|uniref:glycosyltransferase family 2 protein n=1 Tax=Spirosoma lacussanchae TaxID=1884249 RepID=UPI0011084340|nr:glycosyltransferase family 2 protein [Spirosoma lacussanchae]